MSAADSQQRAACGLFMPGCTVNSRQGPPKGTLNHITKHTWGVHCKQAIAALQQAACICEPHRRSIRAICDTAEVWALSMVQSKTFVRLMRPVAGSSLKGGSISAPPLPDVVPEGAPSPGSSLVSCSSAPVTCNVYGALGNPRVLTCEALLASQSDEGLYVDYNAFSCRQDDALSHRFSCHHRHFHTLVQLPSPSGRVPAPVERWEEPSGDKFLVRGADYLKTRKKVPSAASFYR